MIQFHRLHRWGLQSECRKRAHEEYGLIDDLVAFLQSDDRGPVQLPRPRIRMSINNVVDYIDSYGYEVKDECDARGLQVLGSSKHDHINVLIRDDLE